MKSRTMKVAVAMSGGVDSSVAAGLLVEQGYDVQGVSLRMWEGNAGPRVCSDHRGAKEVAAELGIPHTLIDLRGQFADTVVRPFAEDYLRGRTPNPCVACNRDFKFGTLLKWAKERRLDYVATGHYARIVREEGTGGYLFSAARIAPRISPIFSSRSVTTSWLIRCSRSVKCTRATCENWREHWVSRSPIVWRARIFVSAIIRRWWNPTRVKTSLVAVMW